MRKKYSPTDENLLHNALKPTFRWLIAAALDGSDMTYGNVKQKLEDESDFSTIFATRIGFVAGSLMNKILQANPNAPLINVLVVNQVDRQPSIGAGGFMAERFNQPKLKRPNAKENYSKLWEKTFVKAAAEVYSYRPQDWAKLFQIVFGAPLTLDEIKNERNNRQQGVEKDGIPTGRKYGAGGESEYHRNLRLWVRDNPKAIRKIFSSAATETESDLDSGDRIDVVYKCKDRIVLLEVKSRLSNVIDLKRGVYQCIKYRAVRAAMDVRDNPLIEIYLVTEELLPTEIANLLRLHRIKHFKAPRLKS